MSEDASLSDFLEDEVEAAAGDGDDAAESDDAEDVAESDDAEDVAEDDAESERGGGTTPERIEEGRSDPADSEPGDLEDADLEGIAPVRPTYAWGHDIACADCGDRVDRAWRDGDEYVCRSCKDW